MTLIGTSKERHRSDNDGKRFEVSQETYFMPVPLGTYQTSHPSLPVSMRLSRHSLASAKLKLDTFVKVAETSIENGRVRSRICAIVNGNARKDIYGSISLFEPSC